MPLTKTWTAALAVLATAFLAGMFLIASATQGPRAGDATAVRVKTAAALVALEAELRAGSIARAPWILDDPTLRAVLDTQTVEDGERPQELPPLARVFASLAQQTVGAPASAGRGVTVALVDREEATLAAVGDETLVPAALALHREGSSGADRSSPLFLSVGSDIYSTVFSAADRGGRSIVALQRLDGAALRGAVGDDASAALVHGGEPRGAVIGEESFGDVAVELVARHGDKAPARGVGSVFPFAHGGAQRLAALGRVPGTGGEMFLVLASHPPDDASPSGLMAALRAARDEGGGSGINWPLLVGLLALSVTLGLYLPQLELVTPARRMTAGLWALREGTQQRLHDDTYTGPLATLAGAINRYHARLREGLEVAPRTEPARPEPAPLATSTRPRRHRETVIGDLMTAGTAEREAAATDTPERERYYAEVYKAFVEFKTTAGESTAGLTFERFAVKLRTCTADLMRRPGVADVQFSVYLKDGAVALKARVARGAAAL